MVWKDADDMGCCDTQSIPFGIDVNGATWIRMKHRFEAFVLDHEGGMLTRDGIPVDITWRALTCIALLVEQRHRVVGYDELIRKLWGHGDATNHQLSQVVLAARRALGDDGQAQRLIRTIPGHGYRWLGRVSEFTESDSVLPMPLAEAPVQTASPSGMNRMEVDLDFEVESMDEVAESLPLSMREREEPDRSLKPPAAYDAPAISLNQAVHVDGFSVESTVRSDVVRISALRKALKTMVSGLALAVAITMVLAWRDDSGHMSGKAGPGNDSDAGPLALIEDRLWRGDVEGARRQLAKLPADLAKSTDARMLEIKLQIELGRFDDAARRIELDLPKSKAAGDEVWQAKLLTLKSIVASHLGRSPSAVLEPGMQAVELLESKGTKETSRTEYGQALYARGIGFLHSNQYDAAVQDLVASRDKLLQDKDRRSVASTRHMLAYVWLRMGRLNEALDEFEQIAADSRQLKNLQGEVAARNSSLRIQIELLQWDEALANSELAVRASAQVSARLDHAAALRLRAIILMNTGNIREAGVLLDSLERKLRDNRASVAKTMYLLSRGQYQDALTDARELSSTFDESDNLNLILQNREGALLLWAMAAHGLAQAGRSPPDPSTEQLEILKRPTAIQGRIARGWWLCAKGKRDEAERELRQALTESRQQNRIFYMTLAAEPLVAILLERGDVPAAEEVLVMVRGLNPIRVDRDYRVGLLRLRIALAKKDVHEIEVASRIVETLSSDKRGRKRLL